MSYPDKVNATQYDTKDVKSGTSTALISKETIISYYLNGVLLPTQPLDEKWSLKQVREILPTADGGKIEISSIYMDGKTLICENTYKYLPKSDKKILNGKCFLMLDITKRVPADINKLIELQTGSKVSYVLNFTRQAATINGIYQDHIDLYSNPDSALDDDCTVNNNYIDSTYVNGLRNGKEIIRDVNNKVLREAYMVDGIYEGKFTYIPFPMKRSTIVEVAYSGSFYRGKLSNIVFETGGNKYSVECTTEVDTNGFGNLPLLVLNIIDMNYDKLFAPSNMIVTIYNNINRMLRVSTHNSNKRYIMSDGRQTLDIVRTPTTVIQYDTSGNIIRSGMLDSNAYENYSDGNMKLKSSFSNMPDSDIIWDGPVFKAIPQTQLIVKASVINGKYDGLYQEFYRDEKLSADNLDKLIKDYTLEELQKQGKKVLGSLRQQKVFDNGIVNGVDTIYGKNGNILIREYYITGVRVEKAVYAAYIGEVLAEVENIGIISDISGGILAQYLH